MGILEKVAKMTPEQFEKLSDSKKLEWLKALLEKEEEGCAIERKT